MSRDADTPRPRRIKIAFDGITDEDYNSIANALWAMVNTAKHDGEVWVYPDLQADLEDLNDVWADYSETEWAYDPDEEEPTSKA